MYKYVSKLKARHGATLLLAINQDPATSSVDVTAFVCLHISPRALFAEMKSFRLLLHFCLFVVNMSS